ncbi:hypothetical protein IWW38_000643 [Coemansia aciculifera]|uniref:Uncharacterized protein n=1 Tax=Coemansia aciculifera TaxID=417176 RepID=A0ACC1M8L5_9FUNG|nr:hypothetical protein IWW38_000643 [Coemansia aciculifera]
MGKTNYAKGMYIQPVVGPAVTYVADFTKVQIRCRNDNGSSPTTPYLCVTAGSTISTFWHRRNALPDDIMIVYSHIGPCMFYLGKVTPNPDDIKWFKIYELGYNKDTKKWCSEVARDNHGRMDIVIPKDIENGRYLLRTELLTLQNAQKPMGAQFYPNCVQIHITGANNKFLDPPPEYVSFPGVYQPNDTGILYNLRKDGGMTYQIPGPPVYPPVKNPS